ncbi:MAG: (deoxy)nucleoside triphosphate pyrophosphohydrolase [Bacillota bacterium]|jgi:8-oxo-dGTP diphosphatase|nr:(deoxy)nucleoside triphosphate pyrophosphohydrolase [Clostridia bacterium]
MVVTAALIEKDKRVLITQRKADTSQPLKWEFPGGKLEFGETPEHCLFREIQEELNVLIAIKGVFDVVSHIYGDTQVILICYRCSYISGKLMPLECCAFEWATPENILQYDLAAADIPVARKWSSRRLTISPKG